MSEVVPHTMSHYEHCRIGDFLSVAESGYTIPSDIPNSFVCGVQTMEEIDRYVIPVIKQLDVYTVRVGWGENGYTLAFPDRQTRTLFNLAYRGPRR